MSDWSRDKQHDRRYIFIPRWVLVVLFFVVIQALMLIALSISIGLAQLYLLVLFVFTMVSGLVKLRSVRNHRDPW